MNTFKLPKTVKLLIIILCGIAFLFLLFLFGGGWYFSDVLHTKALNPVRPEWKKDVSVISCNENSITLEKILFYDDDYRNRGVYGCEWENSFGIISDIISGDETRATRKFSLIKGDLPEQGTEIIINFAVYPRKPYQIDELPVKEVFYKSELGKFSAFYVNGKEDTWIILVHGNGMKLLVNRRAAISFKDLGYPTLNISFRNDENQPKDPSGIMQFGITEWKDLEGAVTYSIGNGAKNIVLFGMSMGGGIVLNFMYKSTLKNHVIGLILDSPILDFGKTVDLSAKKERIPGLGLPLPQVLTDIAKLIAQSRFNIRWSDINYLKNADKLEVPILLFHSKDDRTIPVSTSDEFAKMRKDLIFRYIRIDGIDHIKSWNYDPESYKRHLSEFLVFIKE